MQLQMARLQEERERHWEAVKEHQRALQKLQDESPWQPPEMLQREGQQLPGQQEEMLQGEEDL